MSIPREYVRPESLTELIRERVIIGKTTFLIDRPGDMEELLDLPEVRLAFSENEYLPYWADVWPAARMLAKAILKQDWPPDTSALELGCGLGIAGLAGLHRGLHIVFSDYELTAVAFAEHNARLNHFEKFTTLPFDWRDPPRDLQVPFVFGADITYESRNHAPLIETLKSVLQPEGECWLTEPDRPKMTEFMELITNLGWTYTRTMTRAGGPGQPRVKGSLWRIKANRETR